MCMLLLIERNEGGRGCYICGWGWRDVMSLKETSSPIRRFMKSPFPGPAYQITARVLFCFHVELSDLSTSSSVLFKGRGAVYLESEGPSQRWNRAWLWLQSTGGGERGEPDLQPIKQQPPIKQPPSRERQRQASSMPDRTCERARSPPEAELSVRPGHQAATASVCSAQTLRYLV